MSFVPIAQRRTNQPPMKPPALRTFYDGPILRLPANAGTLAGFCAWATSDLFPQGLRASFINKEIWLDMTSEELETHIKVKTEIGRVLMNINRKTKLGTFYGDGTLVSNPEAGLSTEPDGTFVTKENLRLKRIRLVPRQGEEGQYMQLEGTPDWVFPNIG